VPMAGTPAEYERMALKSIEKAAEDISDTMYHLTRAKIFAALANASANEAKDASDAGGAEIRSAPAPAPVPSNGSTGDTPAGQERHLPAVRAS
jgi:hypothetical protein